MGWNTAEIVFLRKFATATRMLDMRGISLLHPASKQYMSGLVDLTRAELLPKCRARWEHHLVYGFEKHRTAEEVVTALAEVARRTSEGDRHRGIVIMSLDIKAAFDEAHPGVLDEALKYWRASPRTRLAWLRRLQGLSAIGEVAGVQGSKVEFSRAIRQGCTASPFARNLIARYLMDPLLYEWDRRNMGLPLPLGIRLTRMWWADNLYIVSKSTDEAAEMFSMVTLALRACRLQWKRSAMEFLQVPAPPGEKDLLVEVPGEPPFRLQYRPRLNVLGVDIGAGQEVPMEGRIAAAEKAFWKLKQVLTCPGVPERDRMKTYADRAQAVLLYGSLAWVTSQTAVRRLHAWEGRMLRSVHRCRKRPDEDPCTLR